MRNLPPAASRTAAGWAKVVMPLKEIVAALKAAGYDGYYDVELLGEEIEPADYQSLLEHAKTAFAQLVG